MCEAHFCDPYLRLFPRKREIQGRVQESYVPALRGTRGLEQDLPFDLADVAVAAALARHHFAAPGIALHHDLKKVIAGGILMAMRRARRGRRRTDRRNFLVGSVKPRDRPAMIVTVQDEIGAVRREHLAKFRAVDQSPQMPAGRALRRMMNEHHTEQSACLLE